MWNHKSNFEENMMSRLSLLDPNFKPAFDGPKEAQNLIDKLLNLLPIKEAYLFGSAANGRNTSDSDIDLLIVIPNEAKNDEYYKAITTKHFSKFAADWVFICERDFNRQKTIGGVCQIALVTGIKLWPKDTKN
jgi:Nucleotidyltransferase domain